MSDVINMPQRSNSSASVSAMATNNLSKRVHREVRFGAYILGSTLGEGEFGKVKLGWRKDGRHPSQVAIKLIKRDSIMKDSESEIKIHREINSLRMLNHPNIVNLVEVMKSGKYIGIVLEYASGGELFDYILQHKYLKENVAKKLFAQLVSGVDYMHLKGLIHRDLKLENLLLDKHRNIIISDFGFVNSYNKEKNDLMKTSCGSPCYAAPELVLTQSPYEGRKVDIWSLGVILYAMLSGYLPFDDDAENEDGSDIVRLYHYICKTPLTFPEYVSPLARDLLRKIIVADPRKRMNMNDIRNHPWLAPYANLLSVRQSEWDRIHSEDKERGSMAQMMNPNKHKRYSMFTETTSSSALMLSSTKNPHGRTYTSNSNIIYSNPTTSSSLANVVALTNENNLAASASGASSSSTTLSSNFSTQSNLENGSPTKASQFVYLRGHSKSASISGNYPSASLALKAVVTEHDNKRKSLASLDEHAQTTTGQYGTSQPSLSRSTTYTGTIGTIVESPTNAEFSAADKHKQWMEEIGKNDSSKELPHSQKKPRPTSYHPGSMTSSLITNNGGSNVLLDYIKIPSPMNLPIPQFLSGSPSRSPTAHDLSPTNNEHAVLGSPVSATNIPARSTVTRRDSVVTPINVNGVLTKDLNSHENKRNSVLSYLEDKMEALELTELQSPARNGGHDNTNKPVQIPKLDTTLPPPLNVTPKIDQLPTFAVPTESPSVREKEILPKVAEKPTEKTSQSEKEVQTLKQKELETVLRPRDRNKENREVKEQKKRNRFSLLSFYSNYEASTSTVDVIPHTTKKALEPSRDVNVRQLQPGIKEQNRVGSGSSSKSSTKKSTVSAASSSVNGKEASAARKVMNFFKRRSIRVG